MSFVSCQDLRARVGGLIFEKALTPRPKSTSETSRRAPVISKNANHKDKPTAARARAAVIAPNINTKIRVAEPTITNPTAKRARLLEVLSSDPNSRAWTVATCSTELIASTILRRRVR